MVNKIATRIQSRLSRKSLKVTLGEIKTVYTEMVNDPQNPTDEEVNTVTEHFINQASKLSPIPQTEETIALIDLEENQPEEPEASICVRDETGNIATSTQMEPETLTQFNNEEVEETAIALQETSELVAQTANNMGISLSIEEVTAIAENFDYASENSDYEISEIESTITAFVHHKAQVTKQKITNMVQGVRETVTRLDNENSQLLNDGLREINNDIKRGSQKFKSQVRTALKVFALPPSKAG
ncbi:hypothetical protein [Nodularia chucula]|uniref:hypothetical protein n=1 Tax=Nodularia chucula TaxID=3093667 RepID=UPI0039C6E63A